MTIMRRWIYCSFFFLGGCNLGPDVRAGMWQPSGANERNIQAMLADPTDYQSGKGETGSNGTQAAKAVERYKTDKVRSLPKTSSQSFQPGGSSSSGSDTTLDGTGEN